MTFLPGDSSDLRKARGAFFTPPEIANFLSDWALRGNKQASVLDPTCGEAVFLLSAGARLVELGAAPELSSEQLYGVDLHGSSLAEARRLLAEAGLSASLVESDFFAVPAPGDEDAPFPLVDAVLGNPPFIRFQAHTGTSRSLSRAAALRQGVALNGLASSWAASLVHAAAFLRPEGRLGMVLPAELLTVSYAEPIRTWLRSRFASVDLIVFGELVFADALADVVLLLAEGTGGCESFTLRQVNDASELHTLSGTPKNVTPPSAGKWTDLLIPLAQSDTYSRVRREHFVQLSDYGSPQLGIVTGANQFFTLRESTRQEFSLEESQLLRISPPGTRHLTGPEFTANDWEQLRDSNEKVWLFRPDASDDSKSRRDYTRHGEALGVPNGYKTRNRKPWWRPPTVEPPDIFFAYMSHQYPRMVANAAEVRYVNSMHGLILDPNAPGGARTALPFLALNSLTLLGGEVNGRSYGGGILKLEPREAASMPMPSFSALTLAWEELQPEAPELASAIRGGDWLEVSRRVDEVLLGSVCRLTRREIAELQAAAEALRVRRTHRGGA